MAEQHLEALQQPEHVPRSPKQTPSEFDHTLDGYVQLLGEMQVTQGALGADYRVWAPGHLDWVKETVQPQLEAMNEQRVAAGSEPLDDRTVSPHFLVGLARPNWSEYFPTSDSEDETKRWGDFKDQFTPEMQINLDALQTLHAKVEVLQSDEALQTEFTTANTEHIQDLRKAAMWRSADRKIDATATEMVLLRTNAVKSSRRLTPAEKLRLDALAREQETYRASQRDIPPTSAVQAELYRAKNIDRKRELDSGLLRTEQMNHIIQEVLPALARGEPALFVGETGGAKTALAEFISQTYFGQKPELISGYGDVNTYQLVGKTSLGEQNSASVSTFTPGPVVRAMEEGRPLILDEINAIPAEILKRFNKILQLRPGDTFTVQEDSGLQVTIRPGFCVMATANEKSQRYKGVADLSVELQNRFAAQIYRVRYPDHDVPFGDIPQENGLLAMAAVVDKKGIIPDDLNLDQLHNFVRASHVSQQVFSGNFGEGFRDYLSNERTTDKKPGLDETVLAPRTMVGILKAVAGSNGELTLNQSLTRFVDGIKSTNDKQVMITILRNHGFLQQLNKD
jgi:MoxR-like ATPase